MKNRDQKKKDLEALRQQMQAEGSMFIAGFEKMTVAQDYELRKTIKQAGGDYQVVKNTIAGKAAEGLPHADAFKKLTGMNSVAWTTGDVVTLVKALTGYAKSNPQFTFKAGVVEGRVIDVKSINDLATMPPKEEIYAKLLYLINAPAQRLVTAMNGVGRNVAVVIDQGVQQEKFKS
jgi:large subunit ribosomal protein L10